MQFKDYYAALGVPRTATDAEIKSAYRKLAKQHHPDVNKGEAKSVERFKDISEAYAVLGDTEKRRRYDDIGPEWEPAAAGAPGGRGAGGFAGGGGGARQAGGSGFSDFFDLFFGAGGMPGGGFAGAFDDDPVAAAPTSAPAVATVEISLAEAVNGTQRRLTVRSAPCQTCGGRGTVAHSTSHGRRRVAMSHSVCPSCGGRGVSGDVRTLDVRIPAGFEDGGVLRVRPGGQDIHLTVRYKVPPGVEVRGRDLVLDVPVLDHEAALGARIEVPTLTGSVRVTVPAGASGGSLLRVRGQGLPGVRGGAPGDLLVRLQWVPAGEVSAAERTAYESLRETRTARGADPREGLAQRLRQS